MNDIICPHCKKAFKIDETGYADIVKQVRDSEFDQQLHDRLALAEQEKLTAVELATAKAASASRSIPVFRPRPCSIYTRSSLARFPLAPLA